MYFYLIWIRQFLKIFFNFTHIFINPPLLIIFLKKLKSYLNYKFGSKIHFFLKHFYFLKGLVTSSLLFLAKYQAFWPPQVRIQFFSIYLTSTSPLFLLYLYIFRNREKGCLKTFFIMFSSHLFLLLIYFGHLKEFFHHFKLHLILF
jgi:hypothetical protein